MPLHLHKLVHDACGNQKPHRIRRWVVGDKGEESLLLLILLWLLLCCTNWHALPPLLCILPHKAALYMLIGLQSRHPAKARILRLHWAAMFRTPDAHGLLSKKRCSKHLGDF